MPTSSFHCQDCKCPLFYFIEIDNEIHNICKDCGHITKLSELQAILKETKILEERTQKENGVKG